MFEDKCIRSSHLDRNTHQVPRDAIEGRLRQYHPLTPFYFGLFLNHEQSNNVLQLAFDCYQQALQNFSQLKRELQQISRDKSKEQIDFEFAKENESIV